MGTSVVAIEARVSVNAVVCHSRSPQATVSSPPSVAPSVDQQGQVEGLARGRHVCHICHPDPVWTSHSKGSLDPSQGGAYVLRPRRWTPFPAAARARVAHELHQPGHTLVIDPPTPPSRSAAASGPAHGSRAQTDRSPSPLAQSPVGDRSRGAYRLSRQLGLVTCRLAAIESKCVLAVFMSSRRFPLRHAEMLPTSSGYRHGPLASDPVSVFP